MPSRHRGEREVSLCPYLTPALEGDGRSSHALAALPPGRRSSTHCNGWCVGGHGGWSEWVQKISPLTRVRTWTVQTVASDIPITLCWNMLVYHTPDFITSVHCVHYRARIQVHMQMLKKLQHIL